MRSREEQLAAEFMDNLDYLRERACLAYVHQGITFDQIFDILDKELKIANCALKSKVKPDYVFHVIKVDFRKLRYHSITISSLAGFTMSVKKDNMDVFDQWVEREGDRKQVSFKKWMAIGGTIYKVSDGEGDWSVSDEMRMRHKQGSSFMWQGEHKPYHDIVGKANKILGLE